ncbi:MAG: S1 family peptidase [Mangrovicoccus sp.]|nr:S1 family peptidase [Mangrovicoccus sp.]
MVAVEAQHKWRAVGRLNVAGQGYCTATLIAPDQVLTAAHCLLDRRTGRAVPVERLHFLAGYRAGEYATHARVRRVETAAGYFGEGRPTARDIALVHLRQAVPASAVRPIPLGRQARIGQNVASLSYGRDRSFILSTEASCKILGRRDTLLGTSCEATPGVSGAPLIVKTPRGPEIVGVIAAMTGYTRPAMRGRALAVAADIRARDRLFGRASTALIVPERNPLR